METAVFQVFIGYILSTITVNKQILLTYNYLVAVAKKIVQYSMKLKIELMEEFSEAKIY